MARAMGRQSFFFWLALLFLLCFLLTGKPHQSTAAAAAATTLLKFESLQLIITTIFITPVLSSLPLPLLWLLQVRPDPRRRRLRVDHVLPRLGPTPLHQQRSRRRGQPNLGQCQVACPLSAQCLALQVGAPRAHEGEGQGVVVLVAEGGQDDGDHVLFVCVGMAGGVIWVGLVFWVR
jgi:hypothetical protein